MNSYLLLQKICPTCASSLRGTEFVYKNVLCKLYSTVLSNNSHCSIHMGLFNL